MRKALDITDLKVKIIEAGESAVRQLIKVAREEIIKPDPVKNAAATKKLAVFDAFEILQRIQEEKAILEGDHTKYDKALSQGFAERRSK